MPIIRLASKRTSSGMSMMPLRLATDFLENPVRSAEAAILPVFARFAICVSLEPMEDDGVEFGYVKVYLENYMTHLQVWFHGHRHFPKQTLSLTILYNCSRYNRSRCNRHRSCHRLVLGGAQQFLPLVTNTMLPVKA